jgi:carboxyl-terminal processing protease
MSMEQIASLVRGPKGTTVHLRILRPGAPRPLDFDVARAHIEVTEVSWQTVDGKELAHIVIRQFGSHVGEQLREALAQVRRAGVRGLVLDLRGNPGGLKSQVSPVAGHFLPKGAVLYLEQDSRGQRTTFTVEADEQPTDLPLC